MRLFLFLCILIVSLPNYLSARELKIGIVAFPPWGMETDGQVQGILWQHSLKIFQNNSFNLKAIHLPYPRLIKQLIRSEINCAISLKNSHLLGKVNLISYLYDLNVRLITRHNITINNYLDLTDQNKVKVIGFPNGGGAFFPKLFNDPLIKKQITPSQYQGPLMIARGRLDAFVGIEKTLLYEIRKEKLADKINFPGFFVTKKPMWLHCSKETSLEQQELDIIKSTIKDLINKNTFKRIIDDWIPAITDSASIIP